MKNNKPHFDCNDGWYAVTDIGVCWKLFADHRQTDTSQYEAANEVVKKVLATGKPPFGSWL